MSDYTNLRRRLEDREVIFLDGAIGTQLQSMGVPMDNDAWCALALETHPLIPHVPGRDVLNSIYSTMRGTISAGLPRAFGLDSKGGLRTEAGIIRSTDEMEWN